MRTLVTALGAGLIAGVCGALAVERWSDGRGSGEPVRDARAAAVAPRGDVPGSSELHARIEALELELDLLREQASLVTPAARSTAPPPGTFVTREDLEAALAELEQRLARISAASPTGSSTDTMQALVERAADTLEARRKQEQVDSIRIYQEQRTARLDEDMAKLDQWLELTPAQSGDVRSALLAQYAREDEQRRLWESGADDELLGELKRTDRETFRGELEGALDGEQFQALWSRMGGAGK